MSVEQLQQAVDNYKLLASRAVPQTDEGRNIVRRLIQLRLQLYEAKVIEFV